MNLKVSIVQSDIAWEQSQKNLEHFQSQIEKVAGETDIVVLPEMFTTAFTMNPAEMAVTLEGKEVQWIKSQSEKYGIALAAGLALKYTNGRNTEYYNGYIWAAPGEELKIYHKAHLFRMAGEDKQYNKGTHNLIVSYKGWRIKPLICYDLRFPVWSRNVEEVDGEPDYAYDCAIYIANWPESRRYHWSTLLCARAIENQSYVVGVNRIGTDAKGFTYSGDSAVIDPQGNVISSLQPNEAKVETLELDIDLLQKYRKKFPFVKDADI